MTQTSTETASGFGKIYYDRKLQDYWLRRLVAFIIDAVIVAVAVAIFEAIVFVILVMSWPWWSMHSLVFPLFFGLPLFLYSAFTESIYGYTLGKRIMLLKVVTKDGNKPPLDRALLRNVTKIYWLALLLDLLIALALPNRDPAHRYLDSFAGTSVVSAS